MSYVSDDFDTLARMPSWVSRGSRETPEDAAFFSGAALAHLRVVIAQEQVPQALLRARLALSAAEVCVTMSGRSERARDLRDALAFLQPGDTPGPAGEVYRAWRRAVERPVSVKALHRALETVAPEQIAAWLDAGQGAPVSRAAATLCAVIGDQPRDHALALLLADAVLAQSLRMPHLLPLLSLGLKRADLQKPQDELRAACHRAVMTASAEAVRVAMELARRASRLRAVAPKLRAKGADAAVALFLTQDALAPTALTSLRSDRAARRFCDRLVELGAAHELTGRDTFRLYGI